MLAAFFGAMGGRRIPDVVDWANISGTSPQVNADKTISGLGIASATLTATISGYSSTGGNTGTLQVFRNGSGGSSVSAANGASVTSTIANTDTIHFQVSKGLAGSGTSASWTVTITVGQVTIDTFTVSVNSAP